MGEEWEERLGGRVSGTVTEVRLDRVPRGAGAVSPEMVQSGF